MFSPVSTKKMPDKFKGNAKVGMGRDARCWILDTGPEFHQLLEQAF